MSERGERRGGLQPTGGTAEEYPVGEREMTDDFGTAYDTVNTLLAALHRIEAENTRLRAAVDDVLARDFATAEDISTIDELTPLRAYERGVFDVQEHLAALSGDTDGNAP